MLAGWRVSLSLSPGGKLKTTQTPPTALSAVLGTLFQNVSVESTEDPQKEQADTNGRPRWWVSASSGGGHAFVESQHPRQHRMWVVPWRMPVQRQLVQAQERCPLNGSGGGLPSVAL